MRNKKTSKAGIDPNWIRLNIERVEDVGMFIEQQAAQLGIIVRLDCWPREFGEWIDSHHAQIGKRPHFENPNRLVGWHGRWEGEILSFPKKHMASDMMSDSLSRILELVGRGFYTGTGCNGGVGNPIGIDGGFWLDDFPKLENVV